MRREGCNIKSITAARTTDRRYSRITINVECFDYLIDDLIARIKSLSCVESLMRFEEGNFVEREYAIFSVANVCDDAKHVY